MADLRILQEQSQLLQNMLRHAAEALKAVNARLDQQTEANRKTVADQKLLIDTLAKDLARRARKGRRQQRPCRIAVQEIDALRQLVQQALARHWRRAPDRRRRRRAPRRRHRRRRPPARRRRRVGRCVADENATSRRYGDYAAGLWDLAIDGFEAFLQDFPTATQAAEAQFYIGRAYLERREVRQGRRSLRQSDPHLSSKQQRARRVLPEGVALRSLKQMDQAREAWETVIKNYPDSAAAPAQQRLIAKRSRRSQQTASRQRRRRCTMRPMGSVNKVILVGNLGRDAELRYTPGGAAVATLNMATTEVWNDKAGQRQEKTEWHRVVLWGKTGGVAHRVPHQGQADLRRRPSADAPVGRQGRQQALHH